jgi:hypothetical protein
MEASTKEQASKMESNDSVEWKASRKSIKADQYKLEKQQK